MISKYMKLLFLIFTSQRNVYKSVKHIRRIIFQNVRKYTREVSSFVDSKVYKLNWWRQVLAYVVVMSY